MKNILLALALVSLCACGKNKENKPNGSSPQSKTGKKLTLTVYAETAAKVTADKIETDQEAVKAEKGKASNGDEITCNARVKKWVIDYKVDADIATISINGSGSGKITRSSGVSGSIVGEWFVLERTEDGIKAQISLVIKEDKLGMKVVCTEL